MWSAAKGCTNARSAIHHSDPNVFRGEALCSLWFHETSCSGCSHCPLWSGVPNILLRYQAQSRGNIHKHLEGCPSELHVIAFIWISSYFQECQFNSLSIWCDRIWPGDVSRFGHSHTTIILFTQCNYPSTNRRFLKKKSGISMAKRKTAVNPLLTHCSYCNFALSHRYVLYIL